MTAGVEARALATAALLVAISLASAGSANAADWGLDALMASLRQVKTASAHYVEHTFLHILTQRLDSAGTVKYAAPDRLERTTTTPAGETMILMGDRLTGTRRHGPPYSITLHDHQDVAAMVEGVRSTMAGDLSVLRRYYAISLDGDRAAWQLILVPVNPLVRRKVDWIRITGAASQLGEIDFHQANGDHSEMIITPDKP